MNVFRVLDDFMKENKISWTDCIGICSDGVIAITAMHKDVVNRMLYVASELLQLTVFNIEKLSLQKIWNLCIKQL